MRTNKISAGLVTKENSLIVQIKEGVTVCYLPKIKQIRLIHNGEKKEEINAPDNYTVEQFYQYITLKSKAYEK
jgi:hypothetical protein